MSLSTYINSPGMSTDALFRSAYSPICTSILAVGWAQTADTGQINWITVLKPTVVNTVAGYQMFRMNDALQPTAPVFMKIEYGTGGTTSYGSLWITIGTNTDGAGNLTGVVGPRVQVFSNSSSASSDTCRFSGDSSRLVFCLWPTLAATTAAFFSVERTHDATGADTNIGVMWVSAGSGTAYSQWLALNGGGVISPFTVCSTCVVPTGSGFYGANYALYPFRWFSPGETAPSKNLCLSASTDISNGSFITVNVWYGGTAAYFTTAIPGINYGGASKINMRND